MDRSHAGKCDVARLEVVLDAVEPGVDFAVEYEIGLFQRVVVCAGQSSRLVLDHEHGGQLRPEIRVGHHLHRDPRVDEERGAHAGGHRQHVLGLEPGVHVAGVDVAEGPGARIPGVNGDRCPLDAGGDEEGVVLEPGPGLGGEQVRPSGGGS